MKYFQSLKSQDVDSIILLSHGALAEAVLETAKLIAGDEIPNIHVLCLEGGDNPEDYRNKLSQIVGSIKGNALVLIDLFGGTPCNSILAVMNKMNKKWSIISGLNLPMFLEVLGSRHSADISKLSAIAEEFGRSGICNVGNEMLKGRSQDAVAYKD